MWRLGFNVEFFLNFVKGHDYMTDDGLCDCDNSVTEK